MRSSRSTISGMPGSALVPGLSVLALVLVSWLPLAFLMVYVQHVDRSMPWGTQGALDTWSAVVSVASSVGIAAVALVTSAWSWTRRAWVITCGGSWLLGLLVSGASFTCATTCGMDEISATVEAAVWLLLAAVLILVACAVRPSVVRADNPGPP